uniref:Dynamin-type G domain-containing protein n=1 Tax=Anopheles dirus TaxID=7168 RepID=A0A182NFJ1_9DIPT
MRRISVWVLLGLALFTLSTAGLQVGAEAPTEYECRPYIEKAIQDLKTESAETADENASTENTIDVTSQEEEDNTAAEEVSLEETDTATDDVSEEITPSEEVQEQLFADKTEEEPADPEPAADEASDAVEASEEAAAEPEDDDAADSEEEAVAADQEQADEAAEEDVESEETEPAVSEEAEQSEDVAEEETEEVTSEESANQVLDEGADDEDDDDDDDDDEDAAEGETAGESAEETAQSAEETTDSQEDEADDAKADKEDEDQTVNSEEEEDDDEETPESVDDGEENEDQNNSQEDEEDDDDDDEEEENAVKGSYDDREQEEEEGSEEANGAVSEEASEDTAESDDEENEAAEPEADEQSEEQVTESEEVAQEDEPSEEEPVEESSEAAAASEEAEESSQEPEAQSTEEAADSEETADAGEDSVTESAEEEQEEAAEVDAAVAEGESDEEAAVKQDSAETLAQAGDESVEQASAEAETASQEESFPEEDLLLEYEIPSNLRDTAHIYELLNINDDASAREKALQETADVILRDLKRIYDNSIKPLETLYKYRDLSNRHFGDPEIFSKPLVLFMGPWSGGKSTILNYLTHNEYTPNSVRTGAEPSPAYFNILMHGDEPEVLDGTQLAADWTFSGLQKFGQGLLDRLRGQKLPNKLLERVNIVEIPGILEVRKQVSKYFPFNDACQWFIDRADIIFLVYDPSKLDVGPETEAILDQLKGREYQTRILLNKADQVKPEELLRVQSALIWNISPLMSSAQPPVMYTVSLWSNPFEVGAPVRLLQAQERSLLLDLGHAIDRRIENKIASARRFAVRVRNHAKMVDCYLTTYYNHKTLFGNKKQVSEKIIASPQDYHIYEGLSTLTNISRYDLPDPEVYRDFFHLNPLYEFKKLSETCTYFRGCPINKLDVAIAYDLPELVGKYKKVSEAALAKLDVLTPTSDFGKGKSNS